MEALTPDKVDSYYEAAAGAVEELRNFLSLHHADLIHCSMNVDGKGLRKGIIMDMPAAC